MHLLRRFNQALAKGEGVLTFLVLLSMVLVAGFSAGIRNLTRFDVPWASALLTDMWWADSFLRRGTLWLAFLGASLATYNHKHISIDVLVRIAPQRSKYAMLAFSSVAGGFIALALSYSFLTSVQLNLIERPLEFEILSSEGESIHVCDTTQEKVDEVQGVSRPTGFCLVRSVLGAFGVQAETPGATFQLIVPIMCFIIGLRLIAYGIGFGLTLQKGPEAMRLADEVEHARMLSVHAAMHLPDDSASGKGGV